MAFLVDFLVTKWRKNHKPSETGFSYDDIIWEIFMNEEIPKEAQCEKVQGSVDSISESKILDLKQLPRLEQGGDFASYFALNRLT